MSSLVGSLPKTAIKNGALNIWYPGSALALHGSFGSIPIVFTCAQSYKVLVAETIINRLKHLYDTYHVEVRICKTNGSEVGWLAAENREICYFSGLKARHRHAWETNTKANKPSLTPLI